MDLNQLGFARTGFQKREYLLEFWMEPLFMVGSNRSFRFEVQVAHRLSFSYIIFFFGRDQEIK
jgi:hypothetical protein